MKTLKKILPLTIFILIRAAIPGHSQVATGDYIQVAGLIDIHTDSSDGVHTLDYMVNLARKRGFPVLFINDHDRKVLEYGIPPLRNLVKKKVELPSINKKGAEQYLEMIESCARRNPSMVLIPGAESAPFYFWRGSYFRKNLTVCDWERHLIIVGLDNPEDYKGLPVLHNGLSSKYVFARISFFTFLGILPLLFGIFLAARKGAFRCAGIVVSFFGLLLLVNHHPFRSSPYDQYHGSQGIQPYQLVIDYVNSRGAMVFWNHPETKSGKGTLGPIFKDTPPYSQVLLESENYAGFAALYGEDTPLIEPGGIWDKVLRQYCEGQRARPAWGISSADFHEEGAAGEKLGNFPTVFLVKAVSREDILEAMRKGRMYAYRGDVEKPRWILEEFSVSDSLTMEKAVMGDEIHTRRAPEIHIRLSSSEEERGNPVFIRLVRDGKIVKAFSGETPLAIRWMDESSRPAGKTSYRLDVKDEKGRRLVSNPVFVNF